MSNGLHDFLFSRDLRWNLEKSQIIFEKLKSPNSCQSKPKKRDFRSCKGIRVIYNRPTLFPTLDKEEQTCHETLAESTEQEGTKSGIKTCQSPP